MNVERPNDELADFGGELVCTVGRRQVGTHGVGASTRLADLQDPRIRIFGRLPVMNEHAGAVARERPGGGTADAPRGTGDEGSSAGKVGHGVLLIGWLSRCLYAAVLPPLTPMTWPVMKDALSEAANRMASASSSVRPARFSGIPATIPALRSAEPVNLSSIAVSTGPGAIALTRTPNAAASRAADLVRPSTACLLAT